MRVRPGDGGCPRYSPSPTGTWTHDHPLGLEELEALGVPVKVGVPRVCAFGVLQLRPQPQGRQASQLRVRALATPAPGDSGEPPQRLNRCPRSLQPLPATPRSLLDQGGRGCGTRLR